MASDRTKKLWLVNVASFVLFAVLAFTGLLNWLVLPKGYQARGSFLVSVRHFLVEVHGWIGLILIIMVAIHIMLHWAYIRNNLKKYGVLK
jgi:hypothetical protein